MNDDRKEPTLGRSAATSTNSISEPDKLLRYYDESMYHPLVAEFVGNSDFHNFGYQVGERTDHEQACNNLMEKLLGMIPSRGGRILDVACGKGATTAYLQKYYAPGNITGINISEKQLETARKNAPGSLFHWMSATDLKFDVETFDSVICVEAAFHFETREQFLKEAHRVLKPGGWLVLSDALVTREAERRRIGRFEENYLPDPGAYRELLERTGFRQSSVIDATEECWHGLYRSVVKFAHRKLLNGQCSESEMNCFLEPTYMRLPDMRYYLLAAGRKE